MKKPPDRLLKHRLVLKLTLVAALVLLILGWLSWDAYTDYLYAEAELPKITRMETVRNEIVRLNEMLTMSARMVAASGNLDGEARYLRLKSQLDQSIKEALRLHPDTPQGEAAAMTDAANVALVAMEHRAFELVRQGKSAEAQRLLSSGEYKAQKEIYTAGMTEFNLHLLQTNDLVHKELLAGMRQNVITTGTSVILLILGSLFVFRLTRRWQTVIVESNRQLNRKTAELNGLNDQLDDKVRERTRELNESALASLNMMEDAVQARNGLESVNEQLRSEITQRKRLELEKEQYFKFFMLSTNAMCIADSNGRFKQVNPAFVKLIGYSESELLAKPYLAFVLPEDRQNTMDEMKLQMEIRPTLHFENHFVCNDGTVICLSWTGYYDRLDGITYATADDITERKKSEARIVYLNHVHAVLSGINTLIVRVRDRDELFREACRIAVEAGGFHMAMIGIVDPSTMEIVPVASASKDKKLLVGIKELLLSSEDAPKTMIAQAVREKKVIVSNDTQSDPRFLLARQYAKSGVRSLAILPLIVSDEAAGMLVLCTGESNFFHEEELKLLTELAGNVAYAIDHIVKQEQLGYLAYYDVLTGLANRRLFLERVAQYMRSAASGGHKLALLLIDLERFKNINDSLGRPAGDALLKQVAEWLKHNMGGANLLARVGADHFAIVVPEVKHEGDLPKLFDKKSQAFLDHPFHLNDAVFRIAAKAGIALFPDDGADADTLYKNAEAALKKAKASGDRYLFYTQKMTEAVAGKLTLENQLRRAIDNEEFVLHYQPKVNLASGKVTSAEALIRWNDPKTGLVPPGKFIPILEETGLIYEVGRWALHKAIADYLRWRAAGLAAVRVAVNVSALQLHNPGFIAEIERAIAIDAHAADGLELEITESLIMEDVKHSIATLQAIRAMGITIAIDDFGTGFSSLSYLAKLPVNTLKIDRSFVIKMDAPEGLALVSTIITLAHALKLKVVAEGVETEEQASQLRSLGCEEMQGYLFSKPVPVDIFEAKFLAPLSAG